MEGQRGRLTRILCINCNIRVDRMRRYHALEVDTRVLSLLCTWAHPRIITEDDYVCKACRDLAMLSVNHELQQEASSSLKQAGPRHKGHTNVCALCGSSILRRQSNKIFRDNPSELHQSMINILENRLAPVQITESDRICHPCWLRTQREARRGLTGDTKSIPNTSHPAPEESQKDDQPVGSNSSVPSLNGHANVQRINRDSRQSSSSSTHSVPAIEFKVFCPKCNTDVTHTAEGIHEDQTKALITKVYHYFEQEYEELKKTYEGLDLTPLSKFCRRTALATGVSESTVLEILQKEERRNADEPQAQLPKRGRPPKTPRLLERNVGRPPKTPRLMESSSVDTDNTTEDDGQASCGQEIKVEPESETLVLKLEPEEYNNVQAQSDPIAINVKVEPPDDEMNDTNAAPPLTKRMNILTENGDTSTHESTKASTTEVQTITSRKKSNAQRCREYRERQKLQNTMVQNITAVRSDECSETDQLQAKKPKTNAERRKKHYEAQKLKKQESKKIPKTVKQKNKEYYERKKKIRALNTLNQHSDAQHTQDESSSSQSHRFREELDESSQLGVEDIKVEIEIGEEGFS